MKYCWLNKNNSSKLIIFFSGWGMDKNSVILNYNDFDLIVFYDYQDLVIDNDLITEFSKYTESYIISWSMGVIISTILTKNLNNIQKNIAINGTLKIIDNNFGIAEKIFNATLNNLTSESIKDFFKNMFYDDFKLPKRDFNSQLNELKSIQNFYKNNNFENNNFENNNFKNNNFDKVIISKKDIIVPYKNQKKFWENNNCVFLDSGHYPFHLFKSWEDIINV